MKRNKRRRWKTQRKDCPKRVVNSHSNRRLRKQKRHLKLKNQSLQSLKMIRINIEMSSILPYSIKMIETEVNYLSVFLCI